MDYCCRDPSVAMTRESKRSPSSTKAESRSEVQRQLEALEELAVRLQVVVSYEAMGGVVAGSGGLCRVRGEYRIIIDRRLKASDRVQILSDALRRFDLARVELGDEVRPLLTA
jgi:hypothetical protein